MGLLDTLASTALNQLLGGAQKNELISAALNLLNDPRVGGLPGLVQKFQQSGLADAVASWISTGPNQAVSGPQIETALGANQVQDIAAKTGLDLSQVSTGLAELLPNIINQLTPDGSVPDNSMLEQGLNILRSTLMKA